MMRSPTSDEMMFLGGTEHSVAGQRMNLEKAIAFAIHRGVDTPNELAELLHVDVRDIEAKLREMEFKGLVKCRESGFWIFKKLKCSLTERGYKLAEEAYEELKRRAEELKNMLARTQDPIERKRLISELINEDITWMYVIPLLMWTNMLLPMLALDVMSSLDIGSENIEESDIGSEDIDFGDVEEV